MHSETPIISSFREYAAASNKWSVVFSKLASINVESFIFETPNRVIPRTMPIYKKNYINSSKINLPLNVITSANKLICLLSI